MMLVITRARLSQTCPTHLESKKKSRIGATPHQLIFFL